MKELIFTDEKFIAETTAAIEKAKTSQQILLDTWNSLNIGECPNLFQLIHDPYTVYRKATNNKTPITGKYKVGEAFLEITDTMLPNELYTACRECKRAIFTGHRDLWSIKDGKTIILNQELADTMLHSHDLFAENEKQKEFIEACTALVESNNKLIPVLQSMLTMRSGFSMPVKVTAAGYSFLQQLELDPEAIHEMIKTL